MLSGGERNRLLLARLFLRPANLLIMDEPTNDLDLETLDLLRDTLLNYQGTLILVSHDRDFIDSVVTSIWSFDPDGALREYVGGYTDWLRQRPDPGVIQPETKTKPASQPVTESAPVKKKLAFHEQREYQALGESLERLESEIQALEIAMAEPEFFAAESEIIERETARYQALKQELDATFERYMELDDRAS